MNRDAGYQLMGIEDLTGEESGALKKFDEKLSALAEQEEEIFVTHSIDEAHKIHHSKLKAEKTGLKEGMNVSYSFFSLIFFCSLNSFFFFSPGLLLFIIISHS